MLDERQSSSLRATILVADDLTEWRVRVREILLARPEWQIVSEACDGSEAVQKVSELRPDLVLLDIGMPVLNGLDAAEQIQRISPRSKVVFLTQDNDADMRNAALAAGAHGYVLKMNAASKLLTTIAVALRNGHQTH